MFILYLYFWNKISSLCTNKWRVWCVIFFWKLLNRPLVMLACPSNIKEKSISNPNSRSLLVWEFYTESLEGTRDKYQSMIGSCDMICLETQNRGCRIHNSCFTHSTLNTQTLLINTFNTKMQNLCFTHLNTQIHSIWTIYWYKIHKHNDMETSIY